ncbi:DUF7689 domain-containing protein [Effusibacillus consociatus]|uniref:DUF7689 domain-containing protein n=1 Tax=Effusibacillus consociatus TaxID=1117041 RepID=A0ABV9Q749_9BACL
MFKLKSRKALIATTIAAAIVAGSSTALAGITTPASTLNSNLKVAYNYAWLGDATSQYNCLAYALGNYSSWVWPWGSSNPTSSQVDTYLYNKGYKYGQGMDSQNVAFYEIISYGTSSSIGHFGRFADTVNGTTYSNAKWGQLELLQHQGWSPYTSNGVYGDAYRKYAKQ